MTVSRITLASLVLLTFFWVQAVTGETLAPSAPSEKILLDHIRFIEKKPDFGGEACLAMALQAHGYQASQEDVFNASGVDPVLGRGCVTAELVQAAKKIGVDPGEVWFRLGEDNTTQSVWENVVADLKHGSPSIVCRKVQDAEQFVLIVGWDHGKDQIIFHDPNLANGSFQKLDRVKFLQTCSLLSARGHSSSMICLGCRGKRFNIEKQTGFTDADFAQHIRKLKTRLPHRRFNIVLQKPFVVVGDGSYASVQRASTGTVRWAVDAIKKDYFSKDPRHIIDVWLFKDAASYKRHNLELFKAEPDTPYGYYSPLHRVLVMDISTGGGTLVHEIVHPFMESNFVECPSWFNEGLASLYEQSSSRNGHIIGLTNWRLRGLQSAIKTGRLPSFEELCSTTTTEFYQGAGTNYAQARYLCYYLQEQGLLVKYYHQFKKNVESDPTGFETLKQVLGREDIETFRQQWEDYVMKLRYGR